MGRKFCHSCGQLFDRDSFFLPDKCPRCEAYEIGTPSEPVARHAVKKVGDKVECVASDGVLFGRVTRIIDRFKMEVEEVLVDDENCESDITTHQIFEVERDAWCHSEFKDLEE